MQYTQSASCHEQAGLGGSVDGPPRQQSTRYSAQPQAAHQRQVESQLPRYQITDPDSFLNAARAAPTLAAQEDGRRQALHALALGLMQQHKAQQQLPEKGNLQLQGRAAPEHLVPARGPSQGRAMPSLPAGQSSAAAGGWRSAAAAADLGHLLPQGSDGQRSYRRPTQHQDAAWSEGQQPHHSEQQQPANDRFRALPQPLQRRVDLHSQPLPARNADGGSGRLSGGSGSAGGGEGGVARGNVGPLILSVPAAVQQRPRQPIDVQQLGLGYAAPQYQPQQVHRQPPQPLQLQLQQQPFSTVSPAPRDHARPPPAHQAPPPATASASAAAPPPGGSAGLLVPRSFLARYIPDASPGAVVPVLLTIDDGSHPSGAGGDDETGGVIACHQGDMLVQGDGSGILANAAIGAAVHPYMGGWETVGWRLVGKVMGGLLAIEWQVRPAARFVVGGGTGGLVLAAKPARQQPAPQREAPLPPPPQQQQQELPPAERPSSRGGASVDAPPFSARSGSAAADSSNGPAAGGVSTVLQALLGADGNADPQRLASLLAGSVNGNTAAALAAALLLLTKQGDGAQQQQQQQRSPARDSGSLRSDPEPTRSPVQRQQLPPPSPRAGADSGDDGTAGGSLQQAIQLLMGARAAGGAQQNAQQQQLVHRWKQEHPTGSAAGAQPNRPAPPPSAARPGSSGSPRATLTAAQDDARPQRPAAAQLSQSSRGSAGASMEPDAEVARTAPRGMCRYMTAGELSLLLSESEARLLQHPPCALLVRLRIFLDGAPLGPEQAAQICRYNVSSPRYLTSVPGQEATSPPIPWRLMEGATTQFRRCASGCLQLWAASPRLLPPGWKALVGDTPGITLPGGITTGGAPISAAAAAAMPPLQAVRPASAAGGNDVEMTEAAGGGGGSPVYPAAGLDGGVLDLGTVRTDRRTSAAAAAAAATAPPPPSPLRSVVPAGTRPSVGSGGREEAVGYSEEVLVACPPRSLSRYLTKSELELLVGPDVYKQLCEGNKLADVKVMFEVNGVRNKTVYLADVERYNASSPFYLKAASGRTQDGLPWRSIPQNATVQWRRMADNTLVLAQVPMPQRAAAYATGGQAAPAAPEGAGDARPINVNASNNASGGTAGASGGVGALEPRAVPPRARTRTDAGGGGGEADGSRRRRREQDSDEETEECDSDTVSYASGSEEDEHPSRQRQQPRQSWRKRPAPGGELAGEGRAQQQQEGQLPGGQPLAKRHCAALDASGAAPREDEVMYDSPFGRDEHGGQGEAAEYMRAVEAAEVLAATARGMHPPAPGALAPLRSQQQASSRNASLTLSGGAASMHDNAFAAATTTTKSGSPTNSYGNGASPSPPPPGTFTAAAIPTILAPGLLRPVPGGALYAPLPGAVLPSTVASVATHTNTASSSDASPFISRVVATNLYIGRRQLQALYGPNFKAETTSDMLLALNGVLHTDVYRVTWKEGCHKGSFYPKGAPLGQLRGRFLQGIYWLDDTKSQLVAVAYDNAPPGWPVRRRTTANGAPPKPRRWLWQRQAEKAAKAGPGSGGDGTPPPQQEAQARQQQQQVLLGPAGVTVWQVPVQMAAAPVAASPYQVLTTVPLGTLAAVNPTAAGPITEPPAWQQDGRRSPKEEEEQQRDEAVPAAPSKAPSASQAAAAAALALFTSRVRQGGPGGPADSKDAPHTARPQSSVDSDGKEGRQQQHEQRERCEPPAPREEHEVVGQLQGPGSDEGEKQGTAASSAPRMNVQQLLQLVQGLAQSKQGNGGAAATPAAAATASGMEPAASGGPAAGLRVEPPSDAMEVDQAEDTTSPPHTPPGGDIAAGTSIADAGANGDAPGSPAANLGMRVKVEPPQQLFAKAAKGGSGADAAWAQPPSPTVSECGCGCGDGSGSGKHKAGPGGSPHRHHQVSSVDRAVAEKEGESRKESESAVPQGLLNLMQAAAAAAAAEAGIAAHIDADRAGGQDGVRELHGE